MVKIEDCTAFRKFKYIVFSNYLTACLQLLIQQAKYYMRQSSQTEIKDILII